MSSFPRDRVAIVGRCDLDGSFFHFGDDRHVLFSPSVEGRNSIQALNFEKISTAQVFSSGQVWLNYDRAFQEHAAATRLTDWSAMNLQLYNFHAAGGASLWRSHFQHQV